MPQLLRPKRHELITNAFNGAHPLGRRSLSPYYAAIITYWNLALAFGMVLVIAVISGYTGVRKVFTIEPRRHEVSSVMD